ncbi:MAG: cob(I)yrinic acid a,c-diamide adenosyltransferase [Bacteroidia bacterium]|jgi:cob(I)alamin adenosyltransferase|nr:cob(I)yrinic acid a,c-diamide adenosyltransferase [Bacteroidia bacterium]MCO5254111.1 cob(I)yrinic acid a,c-diamide adenosyltransferase [Bacteroidota bacterium]MCZ2129967.1 cob(I)yrinic acid a,c-diamide adenosyltransferase [Bacteroidia bacterium]
MKIYTKKGDKGMTTLIGGDKVSKFDPRIEAYGTIDELNSYIGILIASIHDQNEKAYLIKVQSDLFNIEALLATPAGKDFKMPEVEDSDIKEMEGRIDNIDNQLERLKNFILPSGSLVISQIHVARCICRRAERIIVQLNEQEEVDGRIIAYINRFSDYLFNLARFEAKLTNTQEILWAPKGVK